MRPTVCIASACMLFLLLAPVAGAHGPRGALGGAGAPCPDAGWAACPLPRPSAQDNPVANVVDGLFSVLNQVLRLLVQAPGGSVPGVEAR